MHDQAVGLSRCLARLLRQAEQADVSAEARETLSCRCRSCWIRQKVDDIARSGRNVLDLVRDLGAELSRTPRGTRRAWADERDARAELEQTENVRARDATEQNIADDRDVQAGDFTSLRSRMAQRPRERLRRRVACAPSPALITLAFSLLARNCGAPAELWRSTISACNASRLHAVFLSVSPFVRLEVVAEILITSALRQMQPVRKRCACVCSARQKVDQRCRAMRAPF